MAPLDSFFVNFGSERFNFCFFLVKGVFAIVEFADEESVTAVLTLESLPLFNGKRLTVKERTVNKAALQVKVQNSRKRKRHDSQQDPEGQHDNTEMAPFLSEDLITKLKSSPTVGGSCILVHISSPG